MLCLKRLDDPVEVFLEEPGVPKIQGPNDPMFHRDCKAAGNGYLSMATLNCQKVFIGHVACGN
jgi:hypothetical protein